MNFPLLSDSKRIERLQPPKGKVRMVLDTDTFNEIDDQFAVLYALTSESQLSVEALYAAPFHNRLSAGPEDGMEKSYQELLKIMALLGKSPEQYVFRGSPQYLSAAGQPVHSEAVTDLVQRALASSEDDPLYVVAIGAPTNVASALLLEPEIIHNIVVVWLGGHDLSWPDANEFNLMQDVSASRCLLDSGVPLVLIPCMGVASHLQTTLSEIRDYVKGTGPIGDYLYETFERCHPDHFGYSRVIWDISTIAFLINHHWVPSVLTHSPILTDQLTWSFSRSRHLIRCAQMAWRNETFKDLFHKLRKR